LVEVVGETMTLANYLISQMGGLATQLGWNSSSDAITTVINNALENYPASAESDCTDLKLHKLADYFLWKQILVEVSFDYNTNSDGASLSRSQQFDHVKDLMDSAYTDALPYLEDYQAVFGEIDYTQNPYNPKTYFVEF
jgi:hypothetical protein